ncbi:MAG: hypothetical protein A2X61_17070 [Ignavibacteria bacterium GWB2_35_12]|nr:MAG: hypothetical protein A2X63_06545 [Ignavibacteria bacterium GWA2_35_8]OGU38061.1 MAG: hypothetical protein A2X61_17070 [Ignavibacteria bacterium GWB2_35_12]OGU95180.1 MAG: hypothetical protein A2220_03280 [Ignavibacteria bacterium RIFOXYA2_FULL_35_10]OGV25017.1 MAG: hypothetical protein A2475_16555 [Ignavibacteria bacterium RIFOXYC2_FULL_35_21]
MKNIIKILLIVAINFTLISHSILPHHHHNGIACFKDKSENTKHQHNNHSEQNQNDERNCNLKQLVILTSGKVFSSDKSQINNNLIEHETIFFNKQYLIQLNSIASYLNYIKNCKEIPKNPLINSITDLRAPPIS